MLKTADWLPIDETRSRCSNCGMEVDMVLMCCDDYPSTRYEEYHYCPWCGKKMKGNFIFDLETGKLHT